MDTARSSEGKTRQQKTARSQRSGHPQRLSSASSPNQSSFSRVSLVGVIFTIIYLLCESVERVRSHKPNNSHSTGSRTDLHVSKALTPFSRPIPLSFIQPHGELDRSDDGYLPILGRTVSALRPHEREIDFASIYPRPGQISSHLHIPRPHVRSKDEL